MPTVDLTDTAFEQTLESNDIVLLDFWASWCGPCKTFAPTYEAVSDDHPDVVFGKVDTEMQEQLAAKFEIRSIPTVMAFREQILVYNQPGVLPEVALRDLIAQIKGLDMDEVRQSITNESAGA